MQSIQSKKTKKIIFNNLHSNSKHPATWRKTKSKSKKLHTKSLTFSTVKSRGKLHAQKAQKKRHRHLKT